MKTISNKSTYLAGLQKSLSVVILLCAFMSNAHAQDAVPVQCKGMENAQCASSEDCSWVQAYERKDGRTVSAFCRSKPKPKSTSSTEGPTNTNSNS